MWKAPSSVLCGCLALLALNGCTGQITSQGQTSGTPPVVIAGMAPYDVENSARFAAHSAAPTAVLVILPVADLGDGADFPFRDRALWAAQGMDVLMPRPTEVYGPGVDPRTALARLVAAAHSLANAPIWLVGPGPAIEAALRATPQPGPEAISGVVVTSITSDAGSCSESVFYSDRGDGAPPQVTVRKSGNCWSNPGAGTGRHPSALPPPAAPQRTPRIIEASALPKNLPPSEKVRQLAQLIKRASPS